MNEKIRKKKFRSNDEKKIITKYINNKNRIINNNKSTQTNQFKSENTNNFSNRFKWDDEMR